MRPFFFSLLLIFLSACSTIIPPTYTNENAAKPSIEIEELVGKLGQTKIVNHLGEKLIVQVIPYTWPVLVDRAFFQYVEEKEPGVRRLKLLFSNYRKKYKEEKCFFVQMTHPFASVINQENWQPNLYSRDQKQGATFKSFLANRSNSFAPLFDKNADHPLLGDKKPVTNIDVCSADLKDFAGEIKLVLSPVKNQEILPIIFSWNFAH